MLIIAVRKGILKYPLLRWPTRVPPPLGDIAEAIPSNSGGHPAHPPSLHKKNANPDDKTGRDTQDLCAPQTCHPHHGERTRHDAPAVLHQVRGGHRQNRCDHSRPLCAQRAKPSYAFSFYDPFVPTLASFQG